MLYRCAQFRNIIGSVCGPVTLSRGIKQGDTISSQLYIRSIEPLLMRLRNEPLFSRDYFTIGWHT